MAHFGFPNLRFIIFIETLNYVDIFVISIAMMAIMRISLLWSSIVRELIIYYDGVPMGLLGFRSCGA
jgi:hypothetical protein